jgi:hypothetical protein
VIFFGREDKFMEGREIFKEQIFGQKRKNNTILILMDSPPPRQHYLGHK